MKVKFKISKNSILIRLILTFFIVIVPIFILGLSISNWGIKTVNNQIVSSMDSQVEYYLNTFEDEIRRIKALQYSCSYDDNLLKLASIPQSLNDFEKYQTIWSLQRRLDAMKSSSMYIRDVSIHIMPVNLTISTVNDVTPLDLEGVSIYNTPPDKSEAQLIYWKGKIFSCMKDRAALLDDKRSPQFVIGIEMSNSSLENVLLKFNKSKDGGALLINPSENYVVTSNSEKDINNKVLSIIKDQGRLMQGAFTSVKVGDKYYTVSYKKSAYLNMVLATYLPTANVYAPIYRYRILILIFTIVSIIIIFVYSFSIYKIIHRPLRLLVDSFRKVENGDLALSIEHNKNDEFQYLYRRFNAMVQNLNTLIDQVYKQKIMNQKAELKQLQAQINPHFLYNSFFILQRMAQSGDIDRTVSFCEHLGKYFQFITRNGQDEVLLSNEINHVKSYAEIQLIRFSNRIDIEIEEIPEEFKDIQVPRLILQPVMENAFEHGLRDKIRGGVITLKFLEEENGFHILIEDNGRDISEEMLKDIQNKLSLEDDNLECTGIINIHRRIRLMFGQGSGLSVSKGEMGGLKVDIFIILRRDSSV